MHSCGNSLPSSPPEIKSNPTVSPQMHTIFRTYSFQSHQVSSTSRIIYAHTRATGTFGVSAQTFIRRASELGLSTNFERTVKRCIGSSIQTRRNLPERFYALHTHTYTHTYTYTPYLSCNDFRWKETRTRHTCINECIEWVRERVVIDSCFKILSVNISSIIS